jgi:hypothetical protein
MRPGIPTGKRIIPAPVLIAAAIAAESSVDPLPTAQIVRPIGQRVKGENLPMHEPEWEV